MFNIRIFYVPQEWQDSSFADGSDAKSRIGFVVLMCEVVVAWGFKLPPTIALSVVEAQYMTLCDANQEVMFLRHLLSDLSYVLKHPTMMMEDTKGCISFATNVMTTSKIYISMLHCILFVIEFVTNTFYAMVLNT